jgi:hypothetical protein
LLSLFPLQGWDATTSQSHISAHVLDNFVTFPLQLSPVLFSAFMFVGLTFSFAYLNVGFLRYLIYSVVDLGLHAAVLATLLKAATESFTTRLSEATVVVAVAVHLVVVPPCIVLYWVYKSKRLEHFMTT